MLCVKGITRILRTTTDAQEVAADKVLKSHQHSKEEWKQLHKLTRKQSNTRLSSMLWLYALRVNKCIHRLSNANMKLQKSLR